MTHDETPAPPAAAARPHHFMNTDGFCHAGDAFEHGTDFIALFTAEQLASAAATAAQKALHDAAAGLRDQPELFRDADAVTTWLLERAEADTSEGPCGCYTTEEHRRRCA